MSMKTRKRPRKQFVIGQADMQPGERRLIEVDGKQIGVFNIQGAYFALHNRCPHMAGNLCAGPITGTAVPVDDTSFIYGMAGEIIRCAWHGWEFEIKSGRCLADPRLRARTYEIAVVDGQLCLYI